MKSQLFQLVAHTGSNAHTQSSGNVLGQEFMDLKPPLQHHLPIPLLSNDPLSKVLEGRPPQSNRTRH
jgi:hypothetical protein